MNKSLKFYLLIAFTLGLAAAGFAADDVSNYYENTVASTVCEGDSNIIKAGCSVAVGQVVRVTPGILTGVTVDKMGSCYDKYKTTNPQGGTGGAVIDLNDPCNQIAMFNPAMKKENYAYIQPNDEEITRQSRAGFTAFTTQMEIFGKKATTGKMLMDRDYYAAKTFKDVPIIGTALAQAPGSSGVNKIKEFIFNVWQLSRNLAYLILLLTSLGLGIYIMGGFTDKDGKIKLTVERAIPRVVIAVVLISSSYWVGELILTSLLGGGIIQGFAAFLSQALFTNNTLTGGNWWLGMPAATVLMGIASILVASSGGSLIVLIIFAIVAAVWRIFIVNFLILKNIFDLLVYIIYSPFVIVGGVTPSDNNGEAFKTYGAKMLKFIAVGFMLNLINYGSKALVAYAVLQENTSADAKIFGSFGDLYGNGGLSWGLVYIFGLVAYIYILYLADKVDATAEKFVKNVTGIGKKEKKDDDK
jgi:hypothetical protein